MEEQLDLPLTAKPARKPRRKPEPRDTRDFIRQVGTKRNLRFYKLCINVQRELLDELERMASPTGWKNLLTTPLTPADDA